LPEGILKGVRDEGLCNPSLRGGNKFKPDRSISETHRMRINLYV